MGCLLGCFGGDKDRKRRKQRNKVLPRDKHSHGCSFSHQNIALAEQKLLGCSISNPNDNALSEQKPHGCSSSNPNDNALSEQPKAVESSPINLIELQDNNNSNKSEDKSSSSSSGSKKRVTFNSNVKTYEHVSPLYESKDSLPDTLKSLTDEEIEQISAKVKQSLSSSEENNSVGSSSVGSTYPTNYRYQNCIDSDDEIEECCDDDDDDIDLDDDANGDDDDEYEEEEDCLDDDDHHHSFDKWSESILTASMESRTENLSSMGVENEVEMFSAVLNPVENLTGWKSFVLARCESEPTPQKENIISLEPIVKPSSSSSNLKPKSGRYEEVRVDASLSTWLSSSSKTVNGRESVCSENSSKSQTSKYVRNKNNLEDRPILGALTVEELKEISKYSSSPRKSPSRSPDEMPIIGSVGSYWNNDSIKEKEESRSVSSYKGIPNTNKKYSEDKKVNWHSTPFEKRLERALNQSSGDDA